MTNEVAQRPWRPWDGRDLAALAACLGLCFVIAALGSAATLPAIPTWYAGLSKPAFSPPNWLFGPVWTVLYGLIAVAVWRVARAPAPAAARRPALLWHGAQLAANWSFAFFGARSPSLGFAVILVLIAAIVVATARTATVDRPAAALMLPYLLWVAFAAVLNGAIVAMN